MKIKDYLNQYIAEPKGEQLPPDYQEYIDSFMQESREFLITEQLPF